VLSYCGMFVGAAGILVSAYTFGVNWINIYKEYVQLILLGWSPFHTLIYINHIEPWARCSALG